MLQSYCDTVYSRSGTNCMGILKNSKELLSNREYPLLKNISSIRTFDFFHSVHDHTSFQTERTPSFSCHESFLLKERGTAIQI